MYSSQLEDVVALCLATQIHC